MRIAVFGGSFNPPHIGHIEAAKNAMFELQADKLIIVPAARPPHKGPASGSPEPEQRFKLAQLAFRDIKNVEVSDIELRRKGIGYTVDTLIEIKEFFPTEEIILLMGSDMFLSIETWKDFKRIFELSAIGVFLRGGDGDIDIHVTANRLRKLYGVEIFEIKFSPIELSSTELRTKLKFREGNNLLPNPVYNEIIKNRFYDAKPNLSWLRENSYVYLDAKRIPHVKGCEQEAVRLAERWGEDTGYAAEAAILHDVTKKLKGSDQLILCEKYGIITDSDEKENYKLLHSKTGASFAREKFGISEEVYSAIFWHTTGRENMTLLEKIIYIADYIEPNRDFEGVNELRKLAYDNIDSAVIKGLQMSLEELCERGAVPHLNSVKALNWLIEHKNDA